MTVLIIRRVACLSHLNTAEMQLRDAAAQLEEHLPDAHTGSCTVQHACCCANRREAPMPLGMRVMRDEAFIFARIGY